MAGPVPIRRFAPPSADCKTRVVRYLHDATDIGEIDREALSDDQRELLEALVPLSDLKHYRVGSIRPCKWRGWFEFCGLADGFFVTFGDVEFDTPQSGHLSAPDTLQVYVITNGDGEYVFPGGDLLSFEAPNTAIIIEPAAERAAEVTFAGRTRYAHVSIHQAALRALFSGSEDELPDVLRAFLEGALPRTLARALPLGPALLRCLEDLQACPLEGRRRRLFLQSKATEILCQAIEALGRGEGQEATATTALTARGVLKAQRLLVESFAAPPTLEDLAHEVGLSRSGLCSGFRQILGQSVFDYIQNLRMEKALTLLNERHASITQIAYAVGYNHVSSFSVAVQRHFGATPTELRRRSASPAAPQNLPDLAS